MTFADKLKSYRLLLDLTQKQLAEVLGVSARSVKYWEAGRRQNSIFQRGAEALLDELLAARQKEGKRMAELLATKGITNIYNSSPNLTPLLEDKKPTDDNDLSFG